MTSPVALIAPRAAPAMVGVAAPVLVPAVIAITTGLSILMIVRALTSSKVELTAGQEGFGLKISDSRAS